ncbi:MAG: hypothetical protein M1819_004098 [Sarea resinae]|nr:MAG: hypothetical protein M1819_004098 [Sarea resinae]
MLMFIVANLLGSTIQITTLPLPVLSTLQASGLVFNSICATLILGEPFTRWSLGGTILVSGGAVLIATFGALGEPAHNLDQLLWLLGRRQFILWMIGQAILVVLIILATRAAKLFNPRGGNNFRMKLFRGLSYGCLSGIGSAHSLLVAKVAVELLVRTIVDRVNQFNRWQSWMILLSLVTLALSQLYYLHCGLELLSTSVLVNIFQIALGTVILLSGVLALSWRLHDESTAINTVSSTPLAPGIGLVEATSDEELEDEDDKSDISSQYATDDEEASIGNPRRNRRKRRRSTTVSTATAAERQPLLSTPKTSRANTKCQSLSPTTKDNAILSVTRPVRRQPTLVEASEIWDELQDDGAATARAFSISSPSRAEIAHRRASTALSTPSATIRQQRHRGLSSGSQDDPRSPSTESTALLRSATSGRTFRSRRRASTQLGTLARERDTASPAGLREPDTAGEWWKMSWFKKPQRRRKERRSEATGGAYIGEGADDDDERDTGKGKGRLNKDHDDADVDREET